VTALSKLLKTIQSTPQNRNNRTLRQQLETGLSQGRRQVDQVRPLLERLGQIPRQHLTPDHRKARQQQEDRYRSDYQKLVVSFNQIIEQSRAVTLTASHMSDDDDDPFDEGHLQYQETKQLQHEVNHHHAVTIERAERVSRIVDETGKVQDMFKELNQLVTQQGKVIDSLENHIELTRVEVKEGESQLLKAHDSQEKKRKSTCWILLLAAIVILVLVVIILNSTS